MMTSELSARVREAHVPRQAEARPGWGYRRGARYILIVAVTVGMAFLVIPSLVRSMRSPMSEASAPLEPAPINGDRAYGYLKQICAIGPRPAGSAANTQQRKTVADHFKKNGATIREQPFSGRDPQSGRLVNMVNLIGSWFPDRADRVVIGVHYDTRPFPDQETDPVLKRTPFVGANDGASGVGLLMEMAHHLSTSPTPWGVDLVLFDGEELVYDRNGEYFLGSKAFAKAYRAERKSGKAKYRYVAGLVLDMIGDRDLSIDIEFNSSRLAPALVREVWGVAERLDARAFRNEIGREVLDDHLPLNDVGIPTIDIIDFDYPFWHMAGDLPEQCSGASMAEVGRVVTAWLAQPRAKTKKR